MHNIARNKIWGGKITHIQRHLQTKRKKNNQHTVKNTHIYNKNAQIFTFYKKNENHYIHTEEIRENNLRNINSFQHQI